MKIYIWIELNIYMCRGEHEIEGIKDGEKWNFEVCLTRLSFIKVTTSVTHASIYRLGSFLEKLS